MTPKIVRNGDGYFNGVHVARRPGIYAIEVLPGLVKFGMSKSLYPRINSHHSSWNLYGIRPLNTAIVECRYPKEEEEDLLKRLRMSPAATRVSREVYRVAWFNAKHLLNDGVRSRTYTPAPWEKNAA